MAIFIVDVKTREGLSMKIHSPLGGVCVLLINGECEQLLSLLR